ncbi:thioester reductase domain-containing protein [Aspergillus pseudonomiae]|uniref:Thioester reductase domain-containing protein n=1 Tax=Aspergillus pseudonomiae TaxID=1506151 RepID=A0A5N7DX14_9EURO|nr:thioester reductase domain-containing protein [Aspergillus pseudonomiae]KAB8261313.1 thioester reductase domain-containing protein [Aspergillus pseudonomiae]KAE8410048.1 thioester reductase domain-containing protein [Aspergillus pseudonomiae]
MVFEHPNLQVPRNCGRRLMPAVLDEVAESDPQRVFVSVPKSSNLADGFKDIPYGTFAKAVNKCAWYLREQLGEDSIPKTILYMGPLDVRYLVIILAAAKAGHMAFFSSLRNSLEAHLSLLDKCGCDTVLVPSRAPAILGQIFAARPMEQIAAPEVDFFFEDLDQVPPIPFTLTWEEAKTKPFCVLHTSGSTGIPKPVFVTYGTFASNDAHQLIPSLGGKPTLINYLSGQRLFLALPVFHAACLTFTLVFNIFGGVTCVLPPPEPLTADLANQAFLHGNLDGALMAPSLIVDCYNNNAHCVNMVQRLKFLSYVGGALPEEVGNVLTTRIKLMTMMGSCETALHPLELNPDPADWQYLTISPFLGHTFRADRDGLSDLVFIRDPRFELFQGVFRTFPDKTEFAMGDLFEQHPRRPESWVFRARTDDIIAFTTAEKLNPVTMESVISANAKVKSAVVGGQGQFQASVLIEPYTYPRSKEEEDQFLRDVWPSILQANRDCPAHGRIMRGFVMLTKPDKPMPRAGKDTVQRHQVLKLYAEEFRELYDRMRPHVKKDGVAVQEVEREAVAVDVGDGDLDRRVEEALQRVLPGAVERAVQDVLARLLAGLTGQLAPVASQSVPVQPPVHVNGEVNGVTNGVEEVVQPAPPELKKVIYDQLGENMDIREVKDDSDLFQFGLDSLVVIDLTNALNTYIIKWRPGKELLEPKVVYDNPTVERILGLVEDAGKA